MLSTKCAKLFLLLDSDFHIFWSFLSPFGHYDKFMRPQLFLIQYLRYRSFISIFLEDEKGKIQESKTSWWGKRKRKNNTLKCLVSVSMFYHQSNTLVVIFNVLWFWIFLNLWRRGFPEILIYYRNRINKIPKYANKF